MHGRQGVGRAWGWGHSRGAEAPRAPLLSGQRVEPGQQQPCCVPSLGSTTAGSTGALNWWLWEEKVLAWGWAGREAGSL